MSELINSTQTTPENNPWAFEYQKNHDLLEQESRTLAKVYEMAVKYDPRLENIEIIPEQLDETGRNQKPFFARKPWKTESGKAEVHILFGDSQVIGNLAFNTIKENPDFKEQVRNMLMSPKGTKVNKNMVRAVIFLHELGHVADFLDHASQPNEYDMKAQAAKNSLPLGYLSSRRIEEKYNSGDANFQQQVISHFGNLENALSSYRRLRHELPFEKKADDFANAVLRQDATSLVALETYDN